MAASMLLTLAIIPRRPTVVRPLNFKRSSSQASSNGRLAVGLGSGHPRHAVQWSSSPASIALTGGHCPPVPVSSSPTQIRLRTVFPPSLLLLPQQRVPPVTRQGVAWRRGAAGVDALATIPPSPPAGRGAPPPPNAAHRSAGTGVCGGPRARASLRPSGLRGGPQGGTTDESMCQESALEEDVPGPRRAAGSRAIGAPHWGRGGS